MKHVPNFCDWNLKHFFLTDKTEQRHRGIELSNKNLGELPGSPWTKEGAPHALIRHPPLSTNQEGWEAILTTYSATHEKRAMSKVQNGSARVNASQRRALTFHFPV